MAIAVGQAAPEFTLKDSEPEGRKAFRQAAARTW